MNATSRGHFIVCLSKEDFKCQESLCNNFKQIEVNGRKMAYVNQIWAYLIEMWTMQRFKF